MTPALAAAEPSTVARRKVTRRERFLALMDQAMPWDWLLATVQPHWPPTDGNRVACHRLDQLLRLYFLQHWYSLDDDALEDALHDSASLRQFAGIDPCSLVQPLGTSMREFVSLLQARRLHGVLLTAATLNLNRQSLRMKRGAIFEASLFSTPT